MYLFLAHSLRKILFRTIVLFLKIGSLGCFLFWSSILYSIDVKLVPYSALHTPLYLSPYFVGPAKSNEENHITDLSDPTIIEECPSFLKQPQFGNQSATIIIFTIESPKEYIYFDVKLIKKPSTLIHVDKSKLSQFKIYHGTANHFMIRYLDLEDGVYSIIISVQGCDDMESQPFRQ